MTPTIDPSVFFDPKSPLELPGELQRRVMQWVARQNLEQTAGGAHWFRLFDNRYTCNWDNIGEDDPSGGRDYWCDDSDLWVPANTPACGVPGNPRRGPDEAEGLPHTLRLAPMITPAVTYKAPTEPGHDWMGLEGLAEQESDPLFHGVMPSTRCCRPPFRFGVLPDRRTRQHVDYFSDCNISISAERWKLMRQAAHEVRAETRRIITAPGSRFVGIPLPEEWQLRVRDPADSIHDGNKEPVDRSRLPWTLRGRVDDSPESTARMPRGGAGGGNQMGYMILSPREDLFIFQRPNLFGSLTLFDMAHWPGNLRGSLLGEIYPELRDVRHVAFEILLGDPRPAPWKPWPRDYARWAEDCASRLLPSHRFYGPLFWSVLHFPNLETVSLVDYSIKPAAGFKPDPAKRAFQARGFDLYDVRAGSPAEWQIVSRDLDKVANMFAEQMVSHWEAWCWTRQRQPRPGNEYEYDNGDAYDNEDDGDDGAGEPQEGLALPRAKETYPRSALSSSWKRRDPMEPAYWEAMAPSGPTPAIKVRILAVVPQNFAPAGGAQVETKE